MNSLQKAILFFFVILIISGLIVPAHANDRYKWMFSSKDNKVDYFFDTKSLTVIKDNEKAKSANVIDVWIRWQFNTPPTFWESLNHVLTHMQIHLETKKIRVIETIYYSNTGGILDKEIKAQSSWENIIPDSNVEGWINHILDYVISNTKEIVERSGV